MTRRSGIFIFKPILAASDDGKSPMRRRRISYLTIIGFLNNEQ